jgi:hypothetical protein
MAYDYAQLGQFLKKNYKLTDEKPDGTYYRFEVEGIPFQCGNSSLHFPTLDGDYKNYYGFGFDADLGKCNGMPEGTNRMKNEINQTLDGKYSPRLMEQDEYLCVLAQGGDIATSSDESVKALIDEIITVINLPSVKDWVVMYKDNDY